VHRERVVAYLMIVRDACADVRFQPLEAEIPEDVLYQPDALVIDAMDSPRDLR
jgi:hypothetical protein